MATRSMFPVVGAVLGSYRLLSILGEGGMGRVYLAEHIKLGRRVALKLLSPDFADSPRAVQSFFAEARAVNTINHENIVEITDFIESENSYYIMELLLGETLQEVLTREGELSTERIVAIGSQISRAIGAAHDAGIVHRDLKPDNVFLIERHEKTDFVKVLDFGIAKLLDDNPVDSAKTGGNIILGTPAFMSPEQAGGNHIDARTDVYSLGILLYQMICGEVPFSAANFGEMVIKHLTVAPRPPRILRKSSAVPVALEELVLACLAKSPDARPASMGEVYKRLAALGPDRPATARLPRQRSRASRGLVTAATALIVGGVLLLYPRFDVPTRATATPLAAPTLGAGSEVLPFPADGDLGSGPRRGCRAVPPV